MLAAMRSQTESACTMEALTNLKHQVRERAEDKEVCIRRSHSLSHGWVVDKVCVVTWCLGTN